MYVSVASNLLAIMKGPDSIIRPDEVQDDMEPAGRFGDESLEMACRQGHPVPAEKKSQCFCSYFEQWRISERHWIDKNQIICHKIDEPLCLCAAIKEGWLSDYYLDLILVLGCLIFIDYMNITFERFDAYLSLFY